MEEQNKKRSLFYDDSTVAGNPGNIKMNALQWAKMNLSTVVKGIVAIVVGYLMMMEIHWVFGIVLIGALLFNFWYWITASNRFKMGDVNLGKVVSVNPDRIAVITDMTKMIGFYPIIKIVETKLVPMERQLNSFIPTVALYKDNPFDYPFWSEFNPTPLSYGTSDKFILQSRLNSFADEDYVELDRLLAQIGTIKPGTYKVDIEASDWKEYPDVIVGDLDTMKGPAE